MATTIGVIIHAPLRDALFSPQDKARLATLGHVRWTDSATPLSLDEACAFLADCEIGVGSWGTAYPTAPLLDACPQLRLWEHVAGSVKHMFGPHMDGRALTIASCAPAIAANVAEMALGELIIGLKRVLTNAAANSTGPAEKPANSQPLGASTIGVIGASNVGRQLIRLLHLFGATVLLYDPYVSDEQAAQLGVCLVGDLTELCAASHAVTLHTPALPATHHLLGAREFHAMRDDAVFVNTSRGSCIDEVALLHELAQGRLFAFLDVSDPEPCAADSPLHRLPNVVYTSHIAGGAEYKLGRQAVDDITAFLHGEDPLMAVQPTMLAQMA